MSFGHLERALRETGDPGDQTRADQIAHMLRERGADVPLPDEPTFIVFSEEEERRIKAILGESAEGYSGGAKMSVLKADEEARRFNHNYIGSEHLLLGILRNDEDPTSQELIKLGIQLSKIRSGVEFVIGRGDFPVDTLTPTPRTGVILGMAELQRRQFFHARVDSSHILVGLTREAEGIGAGILESLGINLEKTGNRIVQNVYPKLPNSTILERLKEV